MIGLARHRSRGKQNIEMTRTLKTGDHVVYVDELRNRHNALVTIWHGCSSEDSVEAFQERFGQGTMPCLNLVFVVSDESKKDPYGRQIERRSSCMHGSRQSPSNLGNYFLFPDE